MSSITLGRDLRGRFGPARDQEARQTCLAFAMSDAHAAAIGGAWSPLSCEYLFYHAKQRDKSAADQGTTPTAIRAALEQDGQPVESEWPYLSQLPSDLAAWKPPKVGTLFRRGSDVGDKAFEEVWKAVEADRPVLLGMTISAGFFTPGVDGVINSDEPVDAAIKHAVVVVATGRKGKVRLLLARNSWGAAWGLSGYAWLGERYATPRVKVALTLN